MTYFQIVWLGELILMDLLDKDTKQISAIIEKRICTYKPPYSVETYDPNIFLKGTRSRTGDYPSWKILFELSEKLNSPLILMTFDTSNSDKLGGSKIIDVSKSGLNIMMTPNPIKIFLITMVKTSIFMVFKYLITRRYLQHLLSRILLNIIR